MNRAHPVNFVRRLTYLLHHSFSRDRHFPFYLKTSHPQHHWDNLVYDFITTHASPFSVKPGSVDIDSSFVSLDK